MKRLEITIKRVTTVGAAVLLFCFAVTAIAQTSSRTKSAEEPYLLFDEGRVQYPGSYRNPMDDLSDTGEEETDTPPEQVAEIQLPSQVCPLETAPQDFRTVNARTRDELISGFDVSAPRAVIFARSRDLTTPVRAGGQIELARTVYNSTIRAWEADIVMGAAFRCGGRVWRVRLDDSLTETVSILGIGPGVVLLLVEGKLAYLRPAGAPPVEFRIVWDTGIDLQFHNSPASQGGRPDAVNPPKPGTPGLPGGVPPQQRTVQRKIRPNLQ